MNARQKRFILSLGLAILMHLLLPLGIVWWTLDSSVPDFAEPVTMVHLITLPPQPEPEPEQVDAVAEANQRAQSGRAMPPNIPALPTPAPMASATEASNVPVEAVAVPKPMARPAQPKPLQKAAVAKPLSPQPDEQPVPATIAPQATLPSPHAVESSDRESHSPEQESPQPRRHQAQSPSKSRPGKPSNTPPAELNLTPSVENLSRWDLNRAIQSRSMQREEEVVDLNTRQVRYASYFAHVKQRIEAAWIYPAEAKRNKLSGNVTLTFTIQRDGQLLNAQVIRSSNAAILDDTALDAVHKIAPFMPFPEDWSLERLTIRATFEYIRRGEGTPWRE
ncbi:MAG: energy transducer TonB [Magnetococcales bacterium]|nr:energy transducer TonB [Magnetococcales bacterium]